MFLEKQKLDTIEEECYKYIATVGMTKLNIKHFMELVAPHNQRSHLHISTNSRYSCMWLSVSVWFLCLTWYQHHLETRQHRRTHSVGFWWRPAPRARPGLWIWRRPQPWHNSCDAPGRKPPSWWDKRQKNPKHSQWWDAAAGEVIQTIRLLFIWSHRPDQPKIKTTSVIKYNEQKHCSFMCFSDQDIIISSQIHPMSFCLSLYNVLYKVISVAR